MKSWKVEAAIIAVGLLLLGIMVKGGINNFVNKDRVVSVKGLAEMEVPADKVVWPLVYKDIGNDPALLYANMEKKNAAIVSFLENNGIEKEEISIAPPEVIDMQAERYVDRNVAYRYNATSVITVTSKNVDRVRKLMSGQAELLKQGIAISGGVFFFFGGRVIWGCVVCGAGSQEHGASFVLKLLETPFAELVGIVHRQFHHRIEGAVGHRGVAARDAVDALHQEVAALLVLVVDVLDVFIGCVHGGFGHNLA